jgi:hypothetical protein
MIEKYKTIIPWILGPKKENKLVINCIDENLGKNVSLIELISRLETRIEHLEQENVSLTNALYETENRLQSQIDKLNPPTYNLQNHKLGEF